MTTCYTFSPLQVQEELREARTALLHLAATSHLAAAAPRPVALSNQVLSLTLTPALPSLSPSPQPARC